MTLNHTHLHTLTYILLLENPPTHLSEVVEIEGQSLITLLVEVGQLPKLGPVIPVCLLIEFHAKESNNTCKILFLSFGPPTHIITISSKNTEQKY